MVWYVTKFFYKPDNEIGIFNVERFVILCGYLLFRNFNF